MPPTSALTQPGDGVLDPHGPCARKSALAACKTLASRSAADFSAVQARRVLKRGPATRRDARAAPSEPRRAARARACGQPPQPAHMADWNDEDDFDEEEYADLYADEDEAAELDLQQDIESEPESVDLSRFESSAEKNVFSRRNRIWIRRAVSKPRRHRKSDEKGDWSESAFPDALDDFRDQQRNQEAFEALRSSARDKEVRNFLIVWATWQRQDRRVRCLRQRFRADPTLTPRPKARGDGRRSSRN